MHSSCCKENHNIYTYRLPAPNHVLWYTRCPDSVHKTVHQVLSYCALGSRLHPALGNFPWLTGLVSEMPRGLPPPPQPALSLFFSGRTTLQCNSPSTAPHSLWNQLKAISPETASLSSFFLWLSAPFPYLAAVKSVTNKYLKKKNPMTLFWTFT